jgi:hypothetical protein
MIATDSEGEIHPGFILFVATSYDGCLILINEVNVIATPEVKLAKKFIKQGERVFNISAPRGLFFPGMVLTYDGFYSGSVGSTEVFTVTAAPGSSGSPIFNSNNEVISIVWSIPVKTFIQDGLIQQKQILENIAIGLQLSNVKDIFEIAKKFDEL